MNSSNSELLELPLEELHNHLISGELTSTEISQAYLDNAKANKSLNAFITLNEEEVLKQAKQYDSNKKESKTLASKKLAGIPIALKDNILAKGHRTTAGSKMLDNFIAPYDSFVAKKLNESGCIIYGNTNMDEFAMGSSTETSFFGSVKNPWDETKVPGGTSGGSAAAVAARLVPVALGTDTGGSVRQPSSFCGTVGFKPTYGRISRYGIIAHASSLDQVGVVAKTVRDTAYIAGIISGHDEKDSTSLEYEPISGTINNIDSLKGLKIGIPRELFSEGLNPDVINRVDEAIKFFEANNATIVDIKLPHIDYATACYYIIAPAEISSNLSRFDGIRYGHRSNDTTDLRSVYLNSRTEGFGIEAKRRIIVGNYVLSSGYYDAYYRKAQKVRTLIKRDFSNCFASECDFILTPTAPTPAFGIGEKIDDPVTMYLNDIFTIPVNLAGLPAVSIPCGFTETKPEQEKKLPIGFQLIGNSFSDENLLKVANYYEANNNWYKESPQ